jgi:hypothetical protein
MDDDFDIQNPLTIRSLVYAIYIYVYMLAASLYGQLQYADTSSGTQVCHRNNTHSLMNVEEKMGLIYK